MDPDAATGGGKTKLRKQLPKMLPLSGSALNLESLKLEGSHRAHHYTEEEWKKTSVSDDVAVDMDAEWCIELV